MRKKLCSVKQPRLRSIVFKTMFAFALTTLITLSQLDVAAQSVFKKNSSLPQRPETTGAVSENSLIDSANPIGKGIEPVIENESSVFAF